MADLDLDWLPPAVRTDDRYRRDTTGLHPAAKMCHNFPYFNTETEVFYLLGTSDAKALKCSQAFTKALNTAPRSIGTRSFPAGLRDLTRSSPYGLVGRFSLSYRCYSVFNVLRKGGVPEPYPFISPAPPDFGGVETALLLW